MHLILARSHCSRSALFALSHSLPALTTARETTMRSMLYALFATTLFLGTPLLAQDAAPQQSLAGPPVTAATYKLTFIVRQLLAGKVTESRSYSSALSQRFFASRPHPSRKQNTAGTIAIAVKNAVQLQRHRSEPRFRWRHQCGQPNHTAACYSSFCRSFSGDRCRYEGKVEPGKPTLLFSSDDPMLDRTTQVELTAVKVP